MIMEWIINYLDNRSAMNVPTCFDNPPLKKGEYELRVKEFLKINIEGNKNEIK